MKTTRYKIAFLSIFVFSATLASGQAFSNAVGARFGRPLSVSYKQFITGQDAIEATLGFRGNTFYNWVTVSGAWQRHFDLGLDAELSPLQWYAGAGASVLFYSYNFGGSVFREDDFSSIGIGIQGYLGLSYAFDEAPVEITVDWIPTIFVGNGFVTGFGGGYGSLGVRYILNR